MGPFHLSPTEVPAWRGYWVSWFLEVKRARVSVVHDNYLVTNYLNHEVTVGWGTKSHLVMSISGSYLLYLSSGIPPNTSEKTANDLWRDELEVCFRFIGIVHIFLFRWSLEALSVRAIELVPVFLLQPKQQYVININRDQSSSSPTEISGKVDIWSRGPGIIGWQKTPDY